MDNAQRHKRLREVAALCRLENKNNDQDIVELRAVLSRIATEKEKDSQFFSSKASTECSTHPARTFGEFVCTLEGRGNKGKSEVLMLTRDSDFGRIGEFLQEAFHLTGGILVTLPEDRLFDEMEQLVLSTKHLHNLLDDFALRQPTRRVLKVLKATLPIVRCLAGGRRRQKSSEQATTLALNQLLELVQVRANVETVSRAGHLSELLGALGSIIGHGSSHTHIAVACHVVWRLAGSAGMRRCVMEHGLQDKLWALAENIARTVETPEHRRAREKAAVTSVEAAEAAMSTDRSSRGAEGTRKLSLENVTAVEEAQTSEEEDEEGEAIPLVAGQELDDIATKCVGAISSMLWSQDVADALAGPGHHNGLEILLELATVAQGRGGIGDEGIPVMAAEALAHVLISHGTCRAAWAEKGNLLSLLELTRSPLDRVILCGTSILNAFLRGDPSQITVTPTEAVKVLKEVSSVCQRYLDWLRSTMSSVKPNETASEDEIPTSAANSPLSLHTSLDNKTQDCLGILEQATAACWGSLAVIDRCPPGPGKEEISLTCWFPTMQAVATLAETKWLSPWVIFCAVACIGVGIGTGARVNQDTVAELQELPGEMLTLLKRTNSLELQEHAARTLCTLLSSNERLRQKAFKQGFLDKLQRILIGRLGSSQLDSTIACSIMFLCDAGESKNGGNGCAGGGGSSEGAETAQSVCRSGAKKKTRTKRGRGARGTKQPKVAVWSQKQLTSLVWALGHSNQDVLTYSAWTLWLLARRPENRVLLGRLWAVDGLVHALRSNARLDTKQGLLAATWLLACDADNTARLAMNGGLQLLVGFLKFPSNSCYVPLKSLAAGTLCKMCRIEPDVATLAMHLSLAPALLEAVYDATSTIYLRVLSAGLIFTLCKNDEHARDRTDYVAQFTGEGGPYILEDICAGFLASGTSELQACGSFMAASLSLEASSRHHLHENGGLEALCRLVRAGNTKDALRDRSLHALLNISTEESCQPPICRWALQALVELAVSGAPPQSEFASSTLCNCACNPSCRAIMFEGQLARGSKDVIASRADRDKEDSIRASLWAGRVATGVKSAARTVQNQFLAWVQEVKGEGFNTPAARPPGGDSDKALTGLKDRNPKATKNDGTSAKVSRGVVKLGGIEQKPKTPLKRRGEDPMLRVRQGIREPVTSLWQTAAERAATAPTRLVSHSGGILDGANASCCRKHPQTGSVRAERGVGASTPPPGVSNILGGAGGDSRHEDGGIRTKSRGRAAREEPGSATGVSAATACGPAGEVVDGNQRGRKTPVPLRSSHRVGPIGSLGSNPLPSGEYRWKPFVSDCYTKPNPLPAWRRKRNEASTDKVGGIARGANGASRSAVTPETTKKTAKNVTKEERDANFCQAVKENQTVVVVEPPLNYKMVFDGPTNSGMAKPLINPISMALFPHVRGASVCAPLYDHYIAEDGLCYHLYHTSRVVCEVLDPGGYPPLAEPTEMRHVLHKALPEAPPPDYPSGRPDAKPVLYLPPPSQCPPISSHFISLCKIACLQAGGGDGCPGATCKMFGAMPSDFMVFDVSERPKVEDDQPAMSSDINNTSKWNVNQSIFAPRRKEAESRTFWDTERVVRKALDTDFGRMLKEERMIKLMAKSDSAVVQGTKTVSESLDEVKKVIAPFYKTILSIFKYYCLTPSQSIRGAFCIQPNQFGKMMQDAEFAGNYISVEEIGKIFVMVNFETDKRSAESTVNEDRALMRFELLEALVRVAIIMRDNEGQEEISPAEKVHAVLEQQLVANLPPEAVEDSDTFRNEILYTEECDNVLQDHQKALSLVYQRYSMLNPVAGKGSFGLEEWKAFTYDARLVGDSTTMLRMGIRDIKQPFYLARMMVSDEIKSRTKMTQLTFVDFLEALARMAMAMPIPSDDDMQDVQVTDILDYEAALSFSVETSSAQQAAVAGATVGLLAPRLDRLLRFIIGTLAIRSNGVIKAGNKGMNLVGLYCTKEHLARGILPL